MAARYPPLRPRPFEKRIGEKKHINSLLLQVYVGWHNVSCFSSFFATTVTQQVALVKDSHNANVARCLMFSITGIRSSRSKNREEQETTFSSSVFGFWRTRTPLVVIISLHTILLLVSRKSQFHIYVYPAFFETPERRRCAWSLPKKGSCCCISLPQKCWLPKFYFQTNHGKVRCR